MSIVLASTSPRRKELMEMLGVQDLKIQGARGEETAEADLPPQELVMVLSAHKAREVAADWSESDIIIAADTIVYADGTVFGKPKSKAQAKEMLSFLSGRWHEVYTGVCLIHDGRELRRYDRTRVHFRALGEAEIEHYIQTGEPMDKAGSYGAQGKGALFVDTIEGDFFNVMGLPVCLLGQMLKEQGVGLL